MNRSPSPDADATWRRFVAFVIDTKDDWRRKMSDVTGLPFGRVRALRRLLKRSLTLRELAEVTSSDAPATTVLVNDLEERGLIVREPHPTNRRAKLVSLTPAGRELAVRAGREMEQAPPAFASLSSEDLAALERVIATLQAARGAAAE